MPKHPALGGNIKVTNPVLSGTMPARVLVARESRQSFTITNVGSVDCYVGGDNTLTTTGATRGTPIKGGATPPDHRTWEYVTGEVWVHCASGDLVVEEVIP